MHRLRGDVVRRDGRGHDIHHGEEGLEVADIVHEGVSTDGVVDGGLAVEDVRKYDKPAYTLNPGPFVLWRSKFNYLLLDSQPATLYVLLIKTKFLEIVSSNLLIPHRENNSL